MPHPCRSCLWSDKVGKRGHRRVVAAQRRSTTSVFCLNSASTHAATSAATLDFHDGAGRTLRDSSHRTGYSTQISPGLGDPCFAALIWRPFWFLCRSCLPVAVAATPLRRRTRQLPRQQETLRQHLLRVAGPPAEAAVVARRKGQSRIPTSERYSTQMRGSTDSRSHRAALRVRFPARRFRARAAMSLPTRVSCLVPIRTT